MPMIETQGSAVYIKAGNDGHIDISAGDGIYNANPVFIRGGDAVAVPVPVVDGGGNVSLVGGSGKKGGDIQIVSGEGSQERGDIKMSVGEVKIFMTKEGVKIDGPLTVDKLQMTVTKGSPVNDVIDGIPVYDAEGVLRGYIPICKQ